MQGQGLSRWGLSFAVVVWSTTFLYIHRLRLSRWCHYKRGEARNSAASQVVEPLRIELLGCNDRCLDVYRLAAAGSTSCGERQEILSSRQGGWETPRMDSWGARAHATKFTDRRECRSMTTIVERSEYHVKAMARRVGHIHGSQCNRGVTRCK